MSFGFKRMLCVFAHPDDEAFGPGGSICRFSEKADVHVVCATSGDAGRNSAIGRARKKELRESAKILGVKSVTFLGFHDGELSNSNYHKVVKKLMPVVRKIKPDVLMTYDTNGVSGHLDHIAMSMITTYVFERSRNIKRLLYFCEKKEIKRTIGKKYFVYFPEGYERRQVDLVVNVEKYLDKKKKAMWAHKSQRADALMITALFRKYLDEEYFRIMRKQRV